MAGLEPATFALAARRSSPSELHSREMVQKGRRGSNPRHPAWKAGALPLSYSPAKPMDDRRETSRRESNPVTVGFAVRCLPTWRREEVVWQLLGRDSNPRRADLQPAALPAELPSNRRSNAEGEVGF